MIQIQIVVAFHSGYGHTRKLAEAVMLGAKAEAGATAVLLDVSSIDEAGWRLLDGADAIVFGAPTYMGGPSAPFKAFADASSKVWGVQGWKDKVGGGFTCSINMCGDKHGTLQYLMNFGMQHGMIWVGTGMMPGHPAGAPDRLNRLGSSIGVAAQAGNVSPELEPPVGDIDTANAYGRRVARLAMRLKASEGPR
ncbi:MAG: flavodoxin family protein [Lautropia sp.]|nr:flavodoxin family protein [Lautropia sp.]